MREFRDVDEVYCKYDTSSSISYWKCDIYGDNGSGNYYKHKGIKVDQIYSKGLSTIGFQEFEPFFHETLMMKSPKGKKFVCRLDEVPKTWEEQKGENLICSPEILMEDVFLI